MMCQDVEEDLADKSTLSFCQTCSQKFFWLGMKILSEKRKCLIFRKLKTDLEKMKA